MDPRSLRIAVGFTIALLVSLDASAQGAIGAPPSRPAVGSSGSSTPPTPRGRPSRPPTSTQPFLRDGRPVTPRFGPARTFRGPRPLWFGVVTFDRSWTWAPMLDDTSADELTASARPGLVGGVQLDIEPRRALVFVDGSYVGRVEQFSGYYHHLEVGAGLHTFEILATDYEPLVFELTIAPGRTTTYRAPLQRASGR